MRVFVLLLFSIRDRGRIRIRLITHPKLVYQKLAKSLTSRAFLRDHGKVYILVYYRLATV
jgi:hypothetical protein